VILDVHSHHARPVNGGAIAVPFGTLIRSLRVDENFYFAWPAFVALLPPKSLGRALCATVAVAIATPAAFVATGDPTHAAYTITLSGLHSVAFDHAPQRRMDEKAAHHSREGDGPW
jgi:hypothetical protein